MPALDDTLAEYRRLRADLETAVLPLATSVDGRRFSFHASLHDLELQVGGYVAIDADGSRWLGQIMSLELMEQHAEVPGAGGSVRIRAAGGAGVLLSGDACPFHDGLVMPAPTDEVRAWLDGGRSQRASLGVAELALAPGVPFALDAGSATTSCSCGSTRSRTSPMSARCSRSRRPG